MTAPHSVELRTRKEQKQFRTGRNKNLENPCKDNKTLAAQIRPTSVRHFKEFALCTHYPHDVGKEVLGLIVVVAFAPVITTNNLPRSRRPPLLSLL